MPRELGDVLHYFMPDKPAVDTARSSARPGRSRVDLRPAAIPLLGVPIGERDVVRAAFTWNLLVEIARLGGRAVLVTPDSEHSATLWPESGVGPMGAEIVLSGAQDFGQLHRDALDAAVAHAPEAEAGGVVLVRIPPAWLARSADQADWLRWSLVFSSGDSRDLLETYGLAKLLLGVHEAARVGVVIHGTQQLSEAESGFARLARSTERHLGRSLESYGLLVDDLHVYRAIVAQRPIGLAHPQSPAARALRDVAQMILDDARVRAVG